MAEPFSALPVIADTPRGGDGREVLCVGCIRESENGGGMGCVRDACAESSLVIYVAVAGAHFRHMNMNEASLEHSSFPTKSLRSRV